jgi:mannose-6-phosphate isomerase-like protein (cupin superfamily)
MNSSEVYYVLEESGKLRINEETYYLEKDDSVYVPPNSKQFIKNLGSINLRFLCIIKPS